MQYKTIFPHIKKAYKTHLLVWFIYVAYELSVLSISLGSFQFFNPNLGIYYIMNIILFYANADLIYRALNRYWLYPIIILGEVLIYSAILFSFEKLLVYLEIVPALRNSQFDSIFLSRTIWRGFFFIGFSIGFVYIIKSIEEAKKSSQLEKENLTTILEKERLENDIVKLENNFLRSQINPHFLFNTLSFIYNGTRKLAPDAASAILSLSEMMRYALRQPTTSELVNLDDEVEQVRNLINLHNLRTKNKAHLELDIPYELNGVKLPPLVLLTLVENIYKHGNLTNDKQPAKLSIIYKDQDLTIRSFNQKSDHKTSESNGVGMANIKKRLESFYKDNLNFTFKDVPPNAYMAELIIKDI